MDGRQVETVSAAAPNVRSNLFFIGAQYYVMPSFVFDGEAFRIIVREYVAGDDGDVARHLLSIEGDGGLSEGASCGTAPTRAFP